MQKATNIKPFSRAALPSSAPNGRAWRSSLRLSPLASLMWTRWMCASASCCGRMAPAGLRPNMASCASGRMAPMLSQSNRNFCVKPKQAPGKAPPVRMSEARLTGSLGLVMPSR
ncbi:hypothetical protein D3C72_2046910 [compost metagenome]